MRVPSWQQFMSRREYGLRVPECMTKISEMRSNRF